jgi:cholesterol oxidase
LNHQSRSPEFDAVIVGSGFGGAVTAYRLAEAGMSVCVLERGKRYPPGSFARTPRQMATNFWDPTEGMFGLFDFWSFAGLNVLVSSGLGGGSLIYANVLLRKDEKWFVEDDADGGMHPWPITRADLEPHYDRAEAMLAPQTYPFEYPPYDETNKTRAFRDAAEKLGLEWFAPNLAVTFANEGDKPVPGEPIREEHRNLHDRTRLTCRLCGECDIGCNYGSKNTVDYNYLSAAKRLGAEIWTGRDVRALEPLEGGGYKVGYIDHREHGRHEPVDVLDASRQLTTVIGKRLVLSCGTLGTTRLLLRNRAALPRISDELGSRFSGNGDLLTFAHRCTQESNGKQVPRPIDPAFGPVITTAIRYGDSLDGDGSDGRGFYIQDAGFPQFLVWLLQTAELPRDVWRLRGDAFRLARESLRRDQYRHTGRSALLGRLFGTSEVAAGLLPLLGMGRDVPDGRMYLRHNHLRLDWTKGPGAGRRGKGRSGPFFDRLRGECERLAEALGAEFRDNPLWLLNRVISVHPLGGCPMGRDATEGVVGSDGEVFGYPGLYVADGSVMPGPVGANPCLTIAALADRFSDHIIDQHSREASSWRGTAHSATGAR